MLWKSGPAFSVSLFYGSKDYQDPEFIKSLEDFAVTLSAEVFEEQPVQILIRDETGVVQRRLSPRIGVSDKTWHRHSTAGSIAIDNERFQEAEVAYRAAVQEAASHDSLRPQLVLSLNNLGHSRLLQGFIDDVEPHFQRALELAETTFGKDSYEGSYALHGLARWEQERNRFQEAEVFFRRALEMRQRVRDDRKPDPAEIRGDLISLLISQESFASALKLQQEQCEFLKKTMPKDSLVIAASLRLLATLNLNAGNFRESKQQFEAALATFERSREAAPDEFLSCLWQFGSVCHSLGEYESAERVLRRAIALLSAAESINPLVRADFQEELAYLFEDQAKYEEAEQLHREVLNVRERELKHDHVAVATSLGRLGSIAMERGRYEQASIQLQRAIKIFENSKSHVHRKLADCLHDFASLQQTLGRYDEAEQLYTRALALREEIFGSEHTEVAMTLSTLSELYSNRNDYRAAEPLARRAFEIAERQLGEKHPLVMRTLHRLALVQHGQRKLDAAEKTLRRALQIGEASLGSQHPYLAESQNTLAVVLLEQEREADAEPFLEQALHGFETILGPTHPQLVGPLNNLGALYEQRGRDAIAEQYLERALKLAEGRFGENHPYLVPILTNSARVMRKLNRTDDAEECERRIKRIRTKHSPNQAQPANSFVV